MMESFAASQGWITNFVRRHGIRSVSLHGEGGSVNAMGVSEGMRKLREKLIDYDVDCIFNMDETGLFFKLLPSRSYITSAENIKSVRGTKAMRAKDRITAFVCTNGIGTKLPLAIIGKPKNPRYVRIAKPPIPYLSQKMFGPIVLRFEDGS